MGFRKSRNEAPPNLDVVIADVEWTPKSKVDNHSVSVELSQHSCKTLTGRI